MSSTVTEGSEFELFPYCGAGFVRFGMTPAEAAMHLGLPERVSLNHANDRVEFRSFMNIGYDAIANGVTHFGFGRKMKGVVYGGAQIFTADHRAVLELLADRDGCPYIYLGFVVLLNLGMTLTGFHDDNESQRALTMFPRGAWDKRLPRLKKFTHRRESRN